MAMKSMNETMKVKTFRPAAEVRKWFQLKSIINAEFSQYNTREKISREESRKRINACLECVADSELLQLLLPFSTIL